MFVGRVQSGPGPQFRQEKESPDADGHESPEYQQDDVLLPQSQRLSEGRTDRSTVHVALVRGQDCVGGHFTTRPLISGVFRFIFNAGGSLFYTDPCLVPCVDVLSLIEGAGIDSS